MTCRSPTPETLAAWIDGALSGKEARDVACHVATCPACHAAAEQLRAETDALRQALGQQKAPAHLWARISSRLADEPVPPSGWAARWAGLRGRIARRRRPVLAAALAASVLGGVVLYQHAPIPGFGPSATLQTLAVETAQDYVTFRISQRALDVASDDPTDTLQWLGARVNGALPDMAQNILDYRLIGGRLCWLMGQRLAALTYASGDSQVTVYVMPAPLGSTGGRFALGRDAEFRHAEGPFLSTVWVESGLLIAVVSDQSEAEKARFVAALGRTLEPAAHEV